MLSLSLIVKNEEKNIARVLDSVRGLYDELVIVDTGSTDKTVDIAKTYTDKVYHFDWINDFSKARNFSFSKCTKPWVMWLDADDILKPEDVSKIKSDFINVAHRKDLNYLLINYNYQVTPPTPEGIPKVVQLRERIIRREAAHWVGRCHEHIVVTWGQSHTIKGAAVWHLRNKEDMAADKNRNIELMKLEVEDAPTYRNFLYLGNEYVDTDNSEKAIPLYKKSIEKSNNINHSFQATYKIGQCYERLSDNDNALLWYKKSLDILTEYREPLLGIASVYLSREELTKAIFWLESCLNIKEPKHPLMALLKDNYTFIPLDMLAKAYFKNKQYIKAAETSEKLYKILQQPQLLEDAKLSRSKLKDSYKRPETTTRLNLGCGSLSITGFTNVDLFYQPGVDEVFSLDSIPYADHSVDEIACSHALEHIPRLRAEMAIKEWARVLKKGGLLYLKVPDLEECCRMFISNPEHQESWYMHTIYGVQDHRDTKTPTIDGEVNFGQIHYTGFTERRLHKLLAQAGFVVDKLYKYDGYDTPSLAVEAHIPAVENIKKIAFINNTLVPRYFSYGDYWEDAFRATGHIVDVFRYEQVSSLPSGYDLYFFIEANNRYNTSNIPKVYPKILYTQECIEEKDLQYYDIIATPNSLDSRRWSDQGYTAIHLPNEAHTEKVVRLLNLAMDNTKVEATTSLGTDIIIPSYKSLKYLKLTIDSVRKNTTDSRIIVVNSGDDQEVYSYLQNQKDIALIHSPKRLSFSQAANKGLQVSHDDVVILNNDVIVGKNWLQPLKDSPFDITNPFSNCDKGWIHNKSLNVGNVELVPDMSKEDVDSKAIMSTESPYTDLVKRNKPNNSWVAFYATYIKRRVIDKIGLLDENFINGGEDYDYCRRATKQGFTCGHTFSSFVFHFGGKTRKISEDENFSRHHEEDARNNELMALKNRPTVAIYTGPAWESWTVDSINTTGIGGSETCAALLAKKFAERGYRSIIFGQCKNLEGTYDGVEYLDHTSYDKFKEFNYIDYFISSRKVSPLQHKRPNGKNYIWSHDIFIPEVSKGHKIPNENLISKYICLSPWHQDFFSEWHNVSKDKIFLQRNGLDLSRYEDRLSYKKDPYRLIYSSSPDRGLIHLLKMFKRIKEEHPLLNLHIFYGFYNWEQAVKNRNSCNELQHMNDIKTLMKQKDVFYHGRVSQKRLAEEQMKSSIWLYPTEFTETSCITAVEAMLAGAIPICTSVAALDTTIPNLCGIKTGVGPGSIARCEEEAIALLKNPARQEELRKKAVNHVINTCGWDQIADNWISMFRSNN